MATIGKVNRIPERKQDFEWKILNFFSLSNECDIFYESPPFSFANQSWCFRIYPNGHKSNNSVGYIGLYLIKYSSNLPITLKWSLGLRTVDGKIGKEAHSTFTFENKGDGRGTPKCVLKSELSEESSQLVDNDVFTVFCTLEYPDSNADSKNNQLKDKLLAVYQNLETEKNEKQHLKDKFAILEKKICELESTAQNNIQLNGVVQQKENENSQLKVLLLAVCQNLETEKNELIASYKKLVAEKEEKEHLKDKFTIMEKKISELESTIQNNIQLNREVEQKENENSQLKNQLLAVCQNLETEKNELITVYKKLEAEKNEKQHLKDKCAILEKKICELESTAQNNMQLNRVVEQKENGVGFQCRIM